MASEHTSLMSPAAKDGWMGLKNRFLKPKEEEVNKHLWDSAAPELVVEFCRYNLGSFGKLKSKLLNCSADWIEGFLEHDGLVLIFDSLDALSRKGLGSFMDAVKQLECIHCLRALMNHGECLRHIINCENTQDIFANQISRSLDTENILLKIQILELLSAMCVYSYEGYETTVRTLQQVQKLRMLPYTFSSLVNELQREGQIEYHTTLITFINCLIVSLEDLEERNEVRQEFIALGLLDILDKLRYSENDNLQAQLESFRDLHNHDLEQLEEETRHLAIDIESPTELVAQINKKMIGTQRVNHFIHILQSLLLIEQSTNNEKTDENWRQLDNALTSVIISAISSNDITEFEEKSMLKRALKDCLYDLKISDQNAVTNANQSQQSNVNVNVLKCNTFTQTDAIIRRSKIATTQTEATNSPPLAVPSVKDKSQESKANKDVVPTDYTYPSPPPDLPEVEEAIQKLIPLPPPSMPGVGEVQVPNNIPDPPPSLPGVEDTSSENSGIPRPPPNMPGVCAGNESGDPRVPNPPPNMPGVQAVANVQVAKIIKGKSLPPTFQTPSKKMRTLKWEKITEKDIQKKTGTLWNELDLSLYRLDTQTIHIVEEQYAIKEAAKTNATKVQEKKEKTSFLDQRASMNICIFLKQFKNQNLSKIISDGDESKISLEQMKAFSKLLPDTPVAKQIKGYQGEMSELADADIFFYEFFKLENYEMRVQVLTTKLDYQSEYEELHPNLTKLENTCNEIIQNSSLKKIMGILLSLGNFINHGSYAGSAAGFKISSLNKLNDTRANKPRMTLLNSLVEIVEDKYPDVRGFGSSMPTLEGALRLSADQLTDAVKALKTKIDQTCRKRLKCAQDLKEQIESFLNLVTPQLEVLEGQGKNVQSISAQICKFFAEDPKIFKLEDFMKTLHQFCKDFDKALTDNTNRKEAEARKKRIEEKKKEVKPNLRGLGSSTSGKPQEEGDIIERLMGEIKRGMTLKNVTACRENSVAIDTTLSAPSERRRRISQRRRSNSSSIKHVSVTSQDGSQDVATETNTVEQRPPKLSHTNPQISISEHPIQSQMNGDTVHVPVVEITKEAAPKTIQESTENVQNQENSLKDPIDNCVNSENAPREKESKRKWGFIKQKRKVNSNGKVKKESK